MEMGVDLRQPLLRADSGSGSLLLDHFVGAEQKGFGYLQAERLGRLQIDDEIELDRLLYRHVGWLFAAQYLVGEFSSASKQVGEIRAIGHQPAGVDELPEAEDRRNSLFGDNPQYLVLVRVHERFAQHVKSIWTPLLDTRQGRRNVIGEAQLEDFGLDIQRGCRRPDTACFKRKTAACDIGKRSKPAHVRDDLAQQIDTLACKIVRLHRQARDIAAGPRQALDQA